MIRVVFSTALMALALLSTTAKAADLVSLEMGEFTIDSESPVKPKSVSVLNGQNQLTFSMQLDALVANADGAKTEASSSMSGSFVVMQPHKQSLPSMTIELRGHIIKTIGSTARLDVTIGNNKKSIEWKADEAAAKTFDIILNEVVANGELPVPFPISALVVVNKTAGAGAVLVSLESIDVNISQLKVADRGK
jgi:hypothetical protein